MFGCPVVLFEPSLDSARKHDSASRPHSATATSPLSTSSTVGLVSLDAFDFRADLDLFGEIDCRGVLGLSPVRRCLEVESFNSSERVFNEVLKSSVAKASFSCVDNRSPSVSAKRLRVASLGDLVRVPRVVLVAAVDLFVVVFVVFLVSVSGDVFSEDRRRVWTDNTVAVEQVDVDLTANFTDSTEESEGKVVTAIGIAVGELM